MSSTAIGGILLIIGAYFTFKGKILLSVSVYTLADVCWVIAAFSIGDWFAIATVTIGGILGILALVKMHTGAMRKDLKWK